MKHAENDDRKITEDWLLFNVFELFVAGTETTSFSIIWFIQYMIRFPEVQRKIQEEIDEVIGFGTTVGLHHRQEMPYTGKNSQDILTLTYYDIKRCDYNIIYIYIYKIIFFLII